MQIFTVKSWCHEVNSATVGSSRPELTLHGLTTNSNLFSRNGYWRLDWSCYESIAGRGPDTQDFTTVPGMLACLTSPHLLTTPTCLHCLRDFHRVSGNCWQLRSTSRPLISLSAIQLQKGPCSCLCLNGQPTHQSACWERSQLHWLISFILLPHLPLNANPAEAGAPPELRKTKTLLC